MKYNIIVLFILIPLLCKSQAIQNNNIVNRNIHSSINSSGGDISNEEGNVSYTIGQVYYLSYDSENINTAEGVQQPSIISLRPINNRITEETITMTAYPNPTSDYFVIEASTYNNRSLKYLLTDLHGNFIKEGSIEEPGAKVDISRLAVAIYLLTITDNSQHIKTFRIIKK